MEKAVLALADGTCFHGYSIGHSGEVSGEVVFNTSMTGYQEIISDPSYANQMVAFTYPHIGNVGVNPDDDECDRVAASAIIVREFSDIPSNYRSTETLGGYLRRHKVAGICGIDTRRLVQHVRDAGAQMAVISSGRGSPDDLVSKARALPSMEGLNLARAVSTTEPYDWTTGSVCLWPASNARTDVGCKYSERHTGTEGPLVVVIDCGVKRNILRLLVDEGFRVKVVPWNSTPQMIESLSPQAIFISNGPGDPAAVGDTINTVKELVGKYPLFGICLGHQILGIALGAPTKKLKFGHHGGNHPVRNEFTGRVEITSQNHGFATDETTVPSGLTVSHINLNDHTVEGFEVRELNAFSVQYHPEASPGPSDARYLFKKFRAFF